MKITTYLGIAISMMILFVGCGNDDNPLNGGCNGFNWTMEVSDEAQAFTQALTDYSQDQTVAKCEAYKSAYRNYIDALEGVNVSCFTNEVNEQEYRESLVEARAEVDEIDCSNPDGP